MSKTWVTSSRTPGARPSPVAQNTPTPPSAAKPCSSCSSTTRLRSRQVSVIHGRTPRSLISAAIRVGGRSGLLWCSPTSTASQVGASTSTISATAAGS